MFKLTRFLKDYKKQVFLGPFFKLCEAILELLLPFLMKELIDKGIASGDTGYIIRMGVLMLFTTILGLACALVCQYYASIASQGSGTALRNALFKKIQSFSGSEMDKFGSASLLNRVTNDTVQLQYAVAMLIRLVIRAPFLCIGGLVMAMIINLKLSLIILAVIPIFIIVLYLIMKACVPLFKLMQKKLDGLAVLLRENLSGVRVVRSFSRTEQERQKYADASENWQKTALITGRISGLMNPLTNLILNFAMLAVVGWGANEISAGSMTKGDIVAYVNYLTTILLALIVVANLVVTFTRAAASAQRVNEVFETEPQAAVCAHPITETDNSEPIVSFENVTFYYPGSSSPALRDISFSLKRGQTLGIIGGTGSGKSTIVKLLARLYEPSEGRILFKGVDLNKLNPEILHAQTGFAFQKAQLFSGTIADNIKLGRDIKEEEVRRAAQDAQAEEFILGKEKGYESLLEQGGSNLSGGQKQRLNIARAIAGSPELVILDDSSSALDYATDLKMRRAVLGRKDRAAIVISQRPAAIKDAALILVLDNGRIAGAGEHAQLIETCRVYAEICQSQGIKAQSKEERA
ncbi:MAG TPA: ABC transporter ATP-binding protein/permease [Firmicutes bacterium]|nr:ABC transporter ATP-binding protein/permease [Bacillota bacterium]